VGIGNLSSPCPTPMAVSSPTEWNGLQVLDVVAGGYFSMARLCTSGLRQFGGRLTCSCFRSYLYVVKHRKRSDCAVIPDVSMQRTARCGRGATTRLVAWRMCRQAPLLHCSLSFACCRAALHAFAFLIVLSVTNLSRAGLRNAWPVRVTCDFACPHRRGPGRLERR